MKWRWLKSAPRVAAVVVRDSRIMPRNRADALRREWRSAALRRSLLARRVVDFEVYRRGVA